MAESVWALLDSPPALSALPLPLPSPSSAVSAERPGERPRFVPPRRSAGAGEEAAGTVGSSAAPTAAARSSPGRSSNMAAKFSSSIL